MSKDSWEDDVKEANPDAKVSQPPFRYERHPGNILVLQMLTQNGYVNVPIVDAPKMDELSAPGLVESKPN